MSRETIARLAIITFLAGILILADVAIQLHQSPNIPEQVQR